MITRNFYMRVAAQEYDYTSPITAELPGKLVMLRRQLINATITAPIMEVINKVATSLEKKEILDLEVKAALFWLDTDCVDSVDVLADSILKDKGRFFFDPNTQSYVVVVGVFVVFCKQIVFLNKLSCLNKRDKAHGYSNKCILFHSSPPGLH